MLARDGNTVVDQLTPNPTSRRWHREKDSCFFFQGDRIDDERRRRRQHRRRCAFHRRLPRKSLRGSGRKCYKTSFLRFLRGQIS